METEKLLEKIRKVLKKAHGEPSKFMELITSILDLNREGQIASYPKIIRELWPEDWKEAEDKVEFEKVKWDLLCKRRREINDRLLNSDMCFEFFVELNGEKQFHIISDPQEIYSKRIEELERNLARTKLIDEAAKIETSRNILDDKFKDFEQERVTPRNIKWKWAAVFIVVALVAAAAVFVIRTYYFPQTPSIEPASIETMAHPLANKPSIAVLPFVNMSSEPEQEYFSDGITDELINTLAKITGLKVISRTSAFSFKGKDSDIRTIGEKLKVGHVLEGSVRKAGNKLRITAQLINVADDSNLWSETYDREMKDIFAIQKEISQAIVKSLKIKLLGGEKSTLAKRPTKNLKAYEYYLRGHFFGMKNTPKDFMKAMEYLQKSLSVDPNYAPAYAEIASIYCLIALQPSFPPQEIFLKAKEAAIKALEIDDTLSEAYTSLGMVKNVFEYDWQGAESAFKRAIELSPSHAMARASYSHLLAAVGRINEALEQIRYAHELDPLSNLVKVIGAHISLSARRYDQAIELLQEMIEISPNPMGFTFLGMAYVKKGMHGEAIRTLQKGLHIFPKHPFLMSTTGWVYGMAGKKEEAKKILNEVLEFRKTGYFSPHLISRIYAGMGELDKVFEYLNEAYETRDPVHFPVKTVPSHDHLHSDPRWTALMKKMGLED